MTVGRSRELTRGRSLGLRLGIGVALVVLGCTSRASEASSKCRQFLKPALDIMPGGTSELTINLDCIGSVDTAVVNRVADGPQGGLPQVIVSIAGRVHRLALVTDGLPKIVDAGDVNGDGIIDLLLANADESISIWPTVVLVRTDGIAAASGSEAMGVFQFDPIAEPECDYRLLLPALETGRDGKLLIVWLDTSTPRDVATTACTHVPRARWEVIQGELRKHP